MPEIIQFRKCRFCPKPVRKFKKNYSKTCGSPECYHESRHQGALGRIFDENRFCQHCGNTYVARSASQRWCSVCVPNQSSRARIRRYGISAPEFEDRLKQQDNKCAICKNPNPTELEHSHETGIIRGIVCTVCNVWLAVLENETWIKLAKLYLDTNNKEIRLAS